MVSAFVYILEFGYRSGKKKSITGCEPTLHLVTTHLKVGASA